MNIDQYRAMVAQEKAEAEAKANVQTEQTPTVTTQQTPQAQGEGNQIPVVEGAEGQAQTEQSTNQEPQTILIDGQEYTLDEIKSGMMRQADYTRKTQELARQRNLADKTQKFYQDVLSNDDLREQLEQQGIEYTDPQQLQYEELNAKYHDMLLEKEVERLQDTYEDFDALAVMRFAYDNGYEDLEDAFHLMYSKGLLGESQEVEQTQAIDAEALKEQIRREVLAELQSNVDTGTIITSGAETAPVKDNTPVLSDQERKVARMMRMSEEDYAKWRGIKKR